MTMNWSSNLRSAVVAFVVIGVGPLTDDVGADSSPPPKSAATNTAAAKSATPPALITQNPDGTMTVQKQPAKGAFKRTKKTGLVIPPQVVVPITPAHEKQ